MNDFILVGLYANDAFVLVRYYPRIPAGKYICRNRPEDPARRWKPLLLLLSIVLLLLLSAAAGLAQSDSVKEKLPGYGLVEYVEGEVIIRFHDHVGPAGKAKFRQQDRGSRFAGRQAIRYQGEEGETVEEIMDRYRDHPDVEHVQPNFIYRLIGPVEMEAAGWSHSDHNDSAPFIPDDEFFTAQWALQNDGGPFARNQSGTAVSGISGADISAPSAWNITTGSDDVIVAIFDTGIDYEHPDLADNLFRDSEGRFGVDCSPAAISDSGECSGDPMDRNGHGTHTAGTIGATGNNGIGISGVNWNIRLMAIRVFDDDDETTTASILAGYDYAIENGAMISNHSYGTIGGSDGFDQVHKNRIAQAGLEGHLIIAAAGNNQLLEEGNNDLEPVYPASYDLDNIISVGASDADDLLAFYSNFGVETVDIAAPGDIIYSTWPGGGYHFLSGTSMAAPHVAGVAGLIRASLPDVTLQDLRRRIVENGDFLQSLEGSIRSGKRLNAFRSLPTADLQLIHASPDLTAEKVDIHINGRLQEEHLLYGSTTGFLNIPAEISARISIISKSPGSEGEIIVEKTVNLTRDERFRMIMSGTGGSAPDSEIPGTDLFLDPVDEAVVPDNRVRMLIFNDVTNHGPVSLIGYFVDERPPFLLSEDVPVRTMTDEVEVITDDFDLDVADGPELLDSFRFLISGRGGETVVAVITDSGMSQSPGSRLSVLYSTGEGQGVLAERVTAPGGHARHIPARLELEDNFPNPFYPVTSIQFALPESRDVEVTVYDMLGRRVHTVLNETLQQGIHRVRFNGGGLPSGPYFYRVSAGSEVLDGKMMLIK